MYRQLWSGILASLAINSWSTVAVRADQPPPTAAPQPPPAAARRRPPNSLQATLADYTAKFDWNANAHGPLLIVSPETTHPEYISRMQQESGGFSVPPDPAPHADGTYGIEEIGSFFDRHVVPLDSMSVFAPNTMTELKYEHLPKADPYAGMSAFAKLQLLESTFTPAQWKQAGADDGLGLGELSEKQKPIFLSLLPDPFTAAPAVQKPLGPEGKLVNVFGESVTLTPEQRSQTRIQFARKLDWALVMKASGNQARGGMGVGTGDDLSDTSLTWHLTSPNDFQRRPGQVYGVDLATVVPNRLKPSQLPLDWSALAVTVDLRGATTVGALVDQIAGQTGAHLHCDPRYADLKLLVMGNSAKANDVLRALCWALNATWRRLDQEFVLTDDLVGLGVRHARIADWAAENALLAQKTSGEVAAALRGVDYRALGWSPTDPNRPGDALAAKIDAYEGRAAGEDVPPPLDIPVADLPAAGQELFRKQVDRITAFAKPDPNTDANIQRMQRAFDRPIDNSVVQMGVRLQVAYIVPGLGKMSQSNMAGNTTHPDILTAFADPRKLRPRPADSPAPTTMGEKPGTRAVLARAKTATDWEAIAQMTKVHGFTELWVDLPPDGEDSLAAALRAGKANGLAVLAVVDLLRSPVVDAELDRNILGETISEYILRRRKEMQDLFPDRKPVGQELPSYALLPIDRWTLPDLGKPFLAGGDYHAITDAERRRAAAAVGRVAATPGLAGVVLRDTAPPGFEDNSRLRRNAYFSHPAYDPDRQMGYTAEQRFDCLRQNGFDPIDLSPLTQGQVLRLSTVDIGPPSNLALPFFEDFGSGSANMSFNGKTGDTAGAKGAWGRWCAFRQQERAALIKSAVDGAASHATNLTFLVRNTDDPMNVGSSTFVTADSILRDAAATEEPAGAAGATPPVPGARNAADPSMATGYFSLTSIATSATGGVPTVPERLSAIALAGKQAANWGGTVLDVSDLQLPDVLDLLGKLPPIEAPGAHPASNLR